MWRKVTAFDGQSVYVHFMIQEAVHLNYYFHRSSTIFLLSDLSDRILFIFFRVLHHLFYLYRIIIVAVVIIYE